MTVTKGRVKGMTTKKALLCRAFPLVLALAASAISHGAELKDLLLKAKTDRENPINYKVGEKIRFDFFLDGVKDLPAEAAAKAPLKVKWVRTGDDGKSESGIGDISLDNGFSVETRLDIPGIVRIEAQLVGSDMSGFDSVDQRSGLEKGILFSGGAGVETEKMMLTTKEPADFDAFWEEAKRKLATVPFEGRVKLVDVTPDKLKGKYSVWAVEIPCFGPRPATGWLTMPANAKPGSLPAMGIFDGYNGNNFGVPKVPEHVTGSNIRLHINAHGYEMVGHDAQYYRDFGNNVNGVVPGAAKQRATYAIEPSDYDNPKDTYMYYMAMRVMRAFDYLKTLPEWDGKTLISGGGSQGGLQAMWAAGLVDGLSDARPCITWGCDVGCPRDGGGPYPSRRLGLPPVPGAFYFDAALHAKRVPTTCKVEITRLGLGDYICPPRGVLLSYYNMKCPVKAYLVQGSTHGYVPPGRNQTFTIEK